jgi:diadenosine tetraphosphate (Ap4A) HIT family hydrolase
VYETPRWRVEHCVGPLGVGTLLVKPLRHCLHVGALTGEEAAEMGPLVRQTASCVQDLCEAEQVYVCLWSHAGWEPGHIHFVVQPSWRALEEQHTGPGPVLQHEMFAAAQLPPTDEIEAFCIRARAWFQNV